MKSNGPTLNAIFIEGLDRSKAGPVPAKTELHEENGDCSDVYGDRCVRMTRQERRDGSRQKSIQRSPSK